MDRKFKSNNSRFIVILNLTDGEIRIKFEPLKFWVGIKIIHDVESFEANALLGADFPLVFEIEDDSSDVLNIVVRCYELAICLCGFGVEAVELSFFHNRRPRVPFFICNSKRDLIVFVVFRHR
jgi:hypothetical protein